MIRLNGELKERIAKNRARLSEPQYSAPALFQEGGEWPGDWQGRTMLALACHCAVCEGDEREKTFRQLKEIVLFWTIIQMKTDISVKSLTDYM